MKNARCIVRPALLLAFFARQNQTGALNFLEFKFKKFFSFFLFEKEVSVKEHSLRCLGNVTQLKRIGKFRSSVNK